MSTETKVCLQNHPEIVDLICSCLSQGMHSPSELGVDRLTAPILSILPISAIFKTDLLIISFIYFLYNANKHTIYR